MTVAAQGGGGGSSGLYDVLELILDRGLVIDAHVRVSLIGIELITIDVRVVVASIDTYLRFAEACNRLDLEAEPRRATAHAEAPRQLAEGDGRSASRGLLSGAAEAFSDAYQQAREESRTRQGHPGAGG
ncbi:gas vesicle structural protein GvpA [Streptomyces sp. LP11]|uniref:Gas vesicle protein A n=1 Tax=Streptomyces pyxinicus TaxID=2970331 RepID=A0ABT2B6F8_9ACTN|nr:gas vesicle protein GvpJ [Streptomyces sp. LP11]MCS0603543.1 gas vesicle structural protein GvpA [Streptomyces sp. LP11]